VAADFDGSGRLSLFVANDTTPNFFFENKTPTTGSPLFIERGHLSGLAVDTEGRSQACMGVAAGDADGNGRLDIFVTNFRNEANTLYLQQTENLFVDQTRRYGLFEPTFEMLGFGTQFLDADLDGRLDLVLANGHVGNLSQHGIPYQMRPQFFYNVENRRFVELSSPGLGSYFGQKQLGRSLARLDWNRDGRDDFVTSHLETPAALVTNETRNAGHFLALRLRGVASARDAIGTTAVLYFGGQTQMRQLTAGDGYMASNERILRFGLGKRASVEQVEIRWPSGLNQTLLHPPVDSELLVVEGRDEFVRLSP
jgi:hypothetical protein